MSSKTAAKTTDEETYPCACCDKEMTLDEVNEGCDGWVCDACVEDLSSDAEEEEYAPCVSCSKVELLYTMVIQDSDSFKHWADNILQLHKGIPPLGVYCTECYLNDYKPNK